MTERDRLIKLIDGRQYSGNATQVGVNYIQNSSLADYLIANGVIVPPCKVGDMVFCVSWHSKKTYAKKVEDILIREDEGYVYCACSYTPFEQFCKTVFLTREEAEKALKESEGK